MSETSEWSTIKDPLTLAMPPPEEAWPPVIQSSVRVRCPALRRSPPTNSLLASAVPPATVSSAMLTVGGLAPGAWMSNTRSGVVEACLMMVTPIARATPKIVTLVSMMSAPYVSL